MMSANPYVFFRGRDGDGRVGGSIKDGNVLVCPTPACCRVGTTTAAAAVDNCLGVEKNAGCKQQRQLFGKKSWL